MEWRINLISRLKLHFLSDTISLWSSPNGMFDSERWVSLWILCSSICHLFGILRGSDFVKVRLISNGWAPVKMSQTKEDGKVFIISQAICSARSWQNRNTLPNERYLSLPNHVWDSQAYNVTDAATGFPKIVKMSIPFILTKKNINKKWFCSICSLRPWSYASYCSAHT